MGEEYFGARDAAQKIGIDYFTLLARIRRGKVKASKVGKRLYVIHKDEVERWRKMTMSELRA